MTNSDKRVYVLLSVKWTGRSLVFWGTKTEDDVERRSFGGYTDDINVCEKYTKEEAKYRSEFYEYNGETLNQLKQIDNEGTWIVKIEDLSKLGELVTHYTC